MVMVMIMMIMMIITITASSSVWERASRHGYGRLRCGGGLHSAGGELVMRTMIMMMMVVMVVVVMLFSSVFGRGLPYESG